MSDAPWTAEIPLEESSRMETTVAEISWNNLDSSFSAGDDIAEFGSFSDFLELSNGGIDEQQQQEQSAVAQAAPINQAFEQPVVARGQELETPVDQPVDLQVTTVDQVAASVYQPTRVVNQAELGGAVAQVVQHHHVQAAPVIEQNHVQASPVVEQNHVQAVNNYYHYPGWQYIEATRQWVPVQEQQQIQGVEATYDPYPGWEFNYATYQWVEVKKVENANHYVESNPENNYQAWSGYQSGQWEQAPQAPARQVVVTPPRTADEALRSTAGRPPHAITAFGFGGRLVIMKPRDSFLALEQNQPPMQIFQLSQLQADLLGNGYGNASGPLVGNASMKDVLRWIDEKCSKCVEDPSLASLRYLWGVLKIACQNYGNLRSTVNGPSMGRQEENGPEAALGKLLEPAGTSKVSSSCLHPMPSEQQLQATAIEVKRLLIAGKQQEALQTARNGQLWGSALLLARQLGEKLYSDTLAEMATRQFQPGFPLGTLTLLCAGQQNGVFDGTVDSATQNAVDGMIEEWQENLAIMAANPTNGDERIITYLGDCLWNFRNEVAGAHLCYLVANTAFEPFSTSARVCLIGADHNRFPRTYASPEAIQRTEVFEFAKVTGNSQFILLPFQPYKLIYASILAEAGKISEAQRYCQAVLKTLKTAGHAAEFCKEAAIQLDERLRLHSQGGSTSLVHRFFGNIGLHKMIPTTSKGRDNAESNSRPATASSRSSSMAPSASMEPISDAPIRSAVPVRSISEPDFGRSPQIDSPRAPKTPTQNAFSSFVQRAIGLIRAPSKEAKLGDSNKFRFDENLKCWVEEGAEAPLPAPTLGPPPIAKFVQPEEPMKRQEEASNRLEANSCFFPPTPVKPQQTHVASGIPPIPPSSNHYSARARQNVRSRYVDTFNKGGATTAPPKSSSSLLLPPARPSSMTPAKFFVPAAQDATSSSLAGDPTTEASSQVAVSNGPAPDAWVQGHESNGNPPWSFHAEANHQLTTEGSLPVPPVLQAQPLVVSDGSSNKEASVPLIHTDKAPFGDDMQEVEL